MRRRLIWTGAAIWSRRWPIAANAIRRATCWGGLDRARWLGGAPDPSGKGTIPNITPGALKWSEDEIVDYLTTGFTPEFDSVGGHMAHVVDNMSKLPESDRKAIAAYLKAVPAIAPAPAP